MKRIISFIIMLFLAAVLIGCSVEDAIKKLDAPIIKTVQNNIVYWGSVDNAESYVVNVDDVFEQQTTELNFDLGKVLSESKTGVVKVKAKGNGLTFTDSDWSNEFNYEFVKDDGGNNNQETEKQKLQTPTITGYSNNTVSWSVVDNANGYIVKINGNEEKVYNTSYTVSFSESCDFTIQVKAVVNIGDANYIDSDWSNINNYQYVKENGGTEDNQNKKGTYLNSGIGSSVNVITAKNYADYIKGVSVLNKELLKNDDLFTKNENSKATELTSSSTQLIEDFVEKNTITFDVKVGDNNKKKTMFTNISVGLRASFSDNYSSYSDQYYYSLDAYIERYSLYLNDYSVKEKYQTMYSEDYKKALSELYKNQTEEAFKDFFDLYGTHLIVSGIFGGRLNAYYSAVTNKSTIDESKSGQLKIAVEKGISAVNNTGVNVDVSQEMQKILKTSEFKTAFYASAYGGNTFTATTLEGLNASYENWANSFNGQNYNPVLINYSPNGIIGLWDILPNEFSSMKSSMEQAFINYCDEYYNSLIGLFKPQKGNDYNIKAELLSCDLNNGYDYTDPDPDYQSDKFGFKYDFANFIVKNVGDQEGESYSLRGANEASIYLKLVNDYDNLPRGESNTSRYVCTDSYDGKLYKIPGGDIGKVKVGYGLLIVYITYEDGTSDVRYFENDIFEGKKAGEEILIASGIKKACKIEVIICFELGSWAPGFLGISGYYETNYRINETFNFK